MSLPNGRQIHYGSRNFKPMLRHVSEWEIEYLSSQEVLRSKEFGISKEAKSVRYPVRLLRYWFGYHLLFEEYERKGRSISIAEIGVDSGQMLQFAKLADSRLNRADKSKWWSKWVAVDVDLKIPKLEKAGYVEWQHADLEDSQYQLEGNFDAAICLHVLEHLDDPEAAMRKIAHGVRSGGIVIGGFPVLPHFLVEIRQKQIRKTARKHGHVSVFSPTRVKRMVEQAGCELEFAAGAFFMRSKGSKLENLPGWLRFNLLWGALFPWWPGEIYWVARKK